MPISKSKIKKSKTKLTDQNTLLRNIYSIDDDARELAIQELPANSNFVSIWIDIIEREKNKYWVNRFIGRIIEYEPYDLERIFLYLVESKNHLVRSKALDALSRMNDRGLPILRKLIKSNKPNLIIRALSAATSLSTVSAKNLMRDALDQRKY